MRTHVLDRPRLYGLTLKVVRILPRPVLYGFARLVGVLVFVFSRNDRRKVRHNLTIVFAGQKFPASPRRLLWQFFQNYAFYMVDFFRLLSMTLEESQSFAQLYEGRYHLDEALAKGRGVILLTAHLGHWEIGGLGLRALGYPLTVVTIKHNSLFTNNLINLMRNRHGIRVIELGNSTYDVIEIVHALHRNEVVAVLGDRAFSERAGVATLFGKDVPLPVGPMLLAMTTKAPVVPAFSVMESPGRYCGIIEPALNLRNGPDREQAMKHNLQQVAAVFERFIRRYPDQWFQTESIG
jgi:Kdo2-lipid IVA lauroyltransferase/acyltransferase